MQPELAFKTTTAAYSVSDWGSQRVDGLSVILCCTYCLAENSSGFCKRMALGDGAGRAAGWSSVLHHFDDAVTSLMS